jgi:HK97 family phage major capsid protein
MKQSEKWAKQARNILIKAGTENREANPEELAEVDELLFKSAQARQSEGVRPTDPTAPVLNDPQAQPWARGIDPGTQFIQSDGYKAISNPETRGQKWSTGAIPVGALHTKGTLLEGAGAPGTGTGGGLIPVPDVIPGVVEKILASTPSVADLFSTRLVQTNTVRYIVEGTATSGAAGVAEGGAKPESTLALSTTDEPVKKIATSLVTSDEMIEDAQAAQGYINGRLSYFVKLEDERQILRGGGTNELVGVVGRSGVNVYSRGTVDNNAVCLAKVIANTRGSSFVEPDAIVMSPANWLSTRLLQDDNGQFYGSGPFGNSFGQTAGAVDAGLFGQTLWGKPVILSDYIGAGTALVGNFGQAAQLARRTGITIEASNSHLGLFLSNEVAIRAEERLALCVFRPGAFTTVSGLS